MRSARVPFGLAARPPEGVGPHDERPPAQLSVLQHVARVLTAGGHHERPALAELAAHSQIARIVAGGPLEAGAAQCGIDLAAGVAAFPHLHVAASPNTVEEAEHGDAALR